MHISCLRYFFLLLLILLPLSVHAGDAISFTSPSLPAVVWKTEHTLGRRSAPVIAIQYSDYQCPFCRIAHQRMRAFFRRNRGAIVWVYRHYPLSFHDKAGPAAEAAECAGFLKGNQAFWQFTDAVYEGQGNFDFAAIAKRLSIDTAAFRKCTESKMFATRVQEQFKGGAAAGVNGTPTTFLLNKKTNQGELFIGAQELSTLQTALQKMLEP